MDLMANVENSLFEGLQVVHVVVCTLETLPRCEVEIASNL